MSPVKININPKKLLHSKWTAVKPLHKEKHFMVIRVKYDDEQLVTECMLEAVMSKRQSQIDWRDLKDGQRWRQGWK